MKDLFFCEEMALSASADATNAIDTGEGVNPWGEAVTSDYGTAGLVLRAVAGETAPAGMTGITVSMKHSDDGTNWLPLMSLSNPDGDIAALKPGGRIAAGAVPTGHKRYLKVSFEVAGAISTAGTVTAALQYGY